MATLAETIGATRPQECSNSDNFERLNEYYLRYKKLNIPESNLNTNGRVSAYLTQVKPIEELLEELKIAVHSNTRKNVKILHTANQICRRLKGVIISFIALSIII